jgi:putative tricarboxylic transport membrane protein
MARRDLIAALVLLGFTAGFGLLTLRLPDRGLPNTPGPAFFPGLITLALAILTIALLVRSLRGIAVEPAALPGAIATRGWIALGAFVVYLIAMPTLGFLIASVPFFAVLTWAYGERRIAIVAVTSVAVPVALLLVFRSGFQILLPSGIGW